MDTKFGDCEVKEGEGSSDISIPKDEGLRDKLRGSKTRLPFDHTPESFPAAWGTGKEVLSSYKVDELA